MSSRKSILATLLLAVGALPVFAGQAPPYQWGLQFAAPGENFVQGVATDARGDIYIAGERLIEGENAFLARYTDTGERLWFHSGGPGRVIAYDVAVSPDDFVFVTGTFYDTVDFGGGPIEADGGDFFVAKYTGEGQHVWSRGFGVPGLVDVAKSVAADAFGNVVVVGMFQGGTADFGGVSHTARGSDIFVAKYDRDGSHVWSEGFNGLNDEGEGVAVDADGNMYMTGWFQRNANFGGGFLRSAGQADCVVAKYSPGGTHVWSRAYGGRGWDSGLDIAVAGDGSIVLAGNCGETVDFGTGPYTSRGRRDAFVAVLDGAGNARWFGGYGGAGDDAALGVAPDGNGGALVTGFFEEVVDFGGGAFASEGSKDAFIARYDASGQHLWSRAFGDWAWDFGYAVAVSGGNTVFAGRFIGNVNFGGGAFRSQQTDGFLVAYGEPPDLTLDVMPGACPNRVNAGAFYTNPRGAGHGPVLPVTIYGGERVAADEIDVASLRLEGAAPLSIGGGPSLNQDGAPPDSSCACIPRTFHTDSYVDLRAKFSIRDFTTDIAPAKRGESVVLTLAGTLVDGTPFELTDCIELTGQGLGDAASPAADHPAGFTSIHPNPFNPVTTISYSVPGDTHVEITVHDVEGRRVAVLVDGVVTANEHQVRWNAAGLHSGVYFCRLTAGDLRETRKLLLLK